MTYVIGRFLCMVGRHKWSARHLRAHFAVHDVYVCTRCGEVDLG